MEQEVQVTDKTKGHGMVIIGAVSLVFPAATRCHRTIMAWHGSLFEASQVDKLHDPAEHNS
jgi:hypothetical protein